VLSFKLEVYSKEVNCLITLRSTVVNVVQDKYLMMNQVIFQVPVLISILKDKLCQLLINAKQKANMDVMSILGNVNGTTISFAL